MKTLRASNGETIRLSNEHARYFLSRHRKETSSQMKWVDVKQEELDNLFDKLQEEASRDDLPISVEREGSILNTIMKREKSKQ